MHLVCRDLFIQIDYSKFAVLLGLLVFTGVAQLVE